MPDPNTRRDKALADIAKELNILNRQLAVFVQQGESSLAVQLKPSSFPSPWGEVGTPAEDAEAGKDAPKPPPHVASDHPYFKRSSPDDGAGYEGPYGDGNGQPYS